MSKNAKPNSTSSDRVAIVAGLRTPFVKSSGVFKKLTALDLGTAVISELVARADIDPQLIEKLIYGQVVVSPAMPNIAREIVLNAGLPKGIDAYSVSRACATSTQALVEGAMAIATDEVDIALVGGVDSLSRPPITYSDAAMEALMDANAAKDIMGKAKSFMRLKPVDLKPQPPAIAEYSTGLTMGDSAEKMAKDNQISRQAQDAFALRSHQKAQAAWDQGIYAQEVMPIAVPKSFETIIDKDNVVRADTSLDKLAKLRPVFDKRHGSVTAASSSPLTDGASALLLMRESRAKALGYEPLAFLRAHAFAAVDPNWQLLAAPGIAIPRALQRAQLSLGDIDIVDMHEAFAAQVLSNLQAIGSAAWQKKYAGFDKAVGEVPDDKLNLFGGSISLGHPFAATGARQVLTMAHALVRRGGGKALISQCTAGGLGACVILER
jgi:acetyl-CoA acyltransferase